MKVGINIIFITEHRFLIDFEFLITISHVMPCLPLDPFSGFLEFQVRISDNATPSNIARNMASLKIKGYV